MDQNSADSQNPYASPASSTDAEKTSNRFANKFDEPLREPIRISGTLTLEEYNCGIDMVLNRSKRWFYLLLLLALSSLLCLLLYKEFQGNPPWWAFSGVSISISLGILMLLANWNANRRLSKALLHGKGAFQPWSYVIDEEGFELHTENGYIRTLWADQVMFRKNDRMVVLFSAGLQGVLLHSNLFLPRRAFQTSECWEIFLDLLKRKAKVLSLPRGNIPIVKSPDQDVVLSDNRPENKLDSNNPSTVFHEETENNSNIPNAPLVRPIIISGDLSYEDYRDFVTFSSRRSFLLYSGAISFVIPLLLFAIFYSMVHYERSITALLVYFFAASIILLILGLIARLSCRSIASWKKFQASYTPKVTEIHEDFIYVPNVHKILFKTFAKYRLQKGICSLVSDDVSLMKLVFARSYFQTQHDWECFIGLLDRKLPRC